jgi:hypothetical protein
LPTAHAIRIDGSAAVSAVGAQGAPDSTKACANHQGVLFHRITPEEKNESFKGTVGSNTDRRAHPSDAQAAINHRCARGGSIR